MLGILISLAMAQTPAVITAEEIKQRFESPITMRTDPVRLPVALDQLGTAIGVRIRCDSELQAAVVVVYAKNQPAKIVFKHLLDGISAGSSIYNGTVQVGMGITSPELEEKRLKGARSMMEKFIEGKEKSAQVDKPIDAGYFTRVGSLALIYIQNLGGDGYRPPHPDIYQVSTRSPLARLYARILRIVGPDALLTDDGKTVSLSDKQLNADQKQLLGKVLDQFAEEQGQTSTILSEFKKISDRMDSAILPSNMVECAQPLGTAKPNGFRLEITSDQWSRSAIFSVMMGGEPDFEYRDYIPKQRVYVAPPGEAFSYSSAPATAIPLSNKAIRFAEFRKRDYNSNQPKPFDFRMAKEVADAWRNEPLSYSRAQPLAEAAKEMNLNAVLYLTDMLLQTMLYDNGMEAKTTLPANLVLQQVQFANTTSGLRKKDDWLLSYVVDPDNYLKGQLDRQTFSELLSLAMRPGALSSFQLARLTRRQGATYNYLGRQFANLVRPGFDSLNPADMFIVEMLSKLNAGQLAALEGNGLPVANLPPELEQRMRAYAGMGRYRRNLPSDTIDAPPTLAEYRRGIVRMKRTVQDGLLCGQGVNETATAFMPYVYFDFRPFSSFRGFDPATARLENFLSSKTCWLAQMESVSLVLEIPRKMPVQLATSQYNADVSVPPLQYNQIIAAINRYFGN